MAESRSVSVTLKANVNDFVREMGRGSKSLDELVKKSGDAAGKSNTAMGRLAQSAKLQSDSWTQAGGAIAGAGAVMTGLTVAVAKTGIEYNTLQQKSRAALTTLTGSAEQANAQMDKLDEFARTSPFSKAIFIEAQQQMLGFGIEAEKVIPYLSAINEAVAATGGSNQDIAELTRIFSQVQAAAKITATDLMQFGQRGVDAATLIGSQMGMTGAEIREKITDGSLDASKALDALAGGMEARFGGASANVKNTMSGAFDRVTAAWRDLSSSIMEGAVGSEGGGWLVDMTNQAADLLRAIEKLPDPVKATVGALGGVAGAGALAAGGLMLVVPRVLETVTAMQTLAATFPKMAAAVGPWTGALALGGLVIAGIAGDIARYRSEVEAYAAAGEMAGEAGEEQARKLAAQKLAAEGVGEALGRLGAEQSLATDAALGDAEARSKIVASYDEHINKLRDLAAEQIAEGNFSEDFTRQADQAVADRDRVLLAIDREMGKRADSLALVGQEKELLGETASAMGDVAAVVESHGTRLSGSFLDAAEALGNLESKLGDAGEALRGYAGLMLSLEGSADGVEAAFDRAAQSIEDNGKTLDAGTEKGRANRETLRGIAEAQNAYTEKLIASNASHADIAASVETARQKYVDMAQQMGDNRDEAVIYTEAIERIPSQVTTSFFLPNMGLSQEEVATLNQQIQDIPPETRAEIITIGYTEGAEAAQRAIDAVKGKTVTIDITTRTRILNLGQAEIATGGLVGDVAEVYGLASGGMARRRFNGLVTGPGTPTSDSVDARLSREEFVTNAAATNYYGHDVMYAMNAKAIPRDYFRAIGLAEGGSPSRTYQPTFTPSLSYTASAGPRSGDTYNVTLSVPGISTAVEIEHVLSDLPRLLAQKGR